MSPVTEKTWSDFIAPKGCIRIDEVMRRFDTTARTIRFYEAKGLISPILQVQRVRYLTRHQVERVSRIFTLKSAGMTLLEIKTYLNTSQAKVARSVRVKDIEMLLKRNADQRAALEQQAITLHTMLANIRSGKDLKI